MWKRAKQAASWKNRGIEDWDERARGFHEWVKANDYAEQFLNRIKVDANSTVLDVGCGPGNLAIPLAKRVKSVTALDISKEMLDYVRKDADKEGLGNIKCVNKGWEDVVTGEDVEICDVAIASRSLVWFDLKESLSKIDRVSRQRVYLTRPVTTNLRHLYEGAYKAIGREYKSGPDYIYVYNLLYQMGTYANVEIFESKSRMCYPSLDKAVEDWRWKIGKLKPDEEERLRAYLMEQLEERNGTFELKTQSKWKWALIWWEKSDETERSAL
jgi:ubiquinone/menaquinone biosynthesis C-methylase UbiE